MAKIKINFNVKRILSIVVLLTLFSTIIIPFRVNASISENPDDKIIDEMDVVLDNTIIDEIVVDLDDEIGDEITIDLDDKNSNEITVDLDADIDINDLFENLAIDEHFFTSLGGSDSVNPYRILFVFVTTIDAVLYGNDGKCHHVNHTLSKTEKEICELVPVIFLQYLSEWFGDSVDFEIDIYFTRNPLGNDSFITGLTSGRLTHFILADKIPEITSEERNKYDSIVTSFYMKDTEEVLHSTGGTAVARYAAIHLESFLNSFVVNGEPLENLLNTSDVIWNTIMSNYFHEFIHTIEQQMLNEVGAELHDVTAYYSMKETNPLWGMDVYKLYLLGKAEMGGKKVGIPPSYMAQFVEQYTVTFKNWDGKIIDEITLGRGRDIINIPTATREGHTFIGWNRDTFTNIRENFITTAQFSINRHTVVFKNWDGEVLGTRTVDWGTAITDAPTATRDGITFTGWCTPITNVRSDFVTTAQFTFNIQSIALNQTNTTINARKTALARIPIQLNVKGDFNPNENNIVKSARFSGNARSHFSIKVINDGLIEITPTNRLLNVDIITSLRTKLEITTYCDNTHITTNDLTIRVTRSTSTKPTTRLNPSTVTMNKEATLQVNSNRIIGDIRIVPNTKNDSHLYTINDVTPDGSFHLTYTGDGNVPRNIRLRLEVSLEGMNNKIFLNLNVRRVPANNSVRLSRTSVTLSNTANTTKENNAIVNINPTIIDSDLNNFSWEYLENRGVNASDHIIINWEKGSRTAKITLKENAQHGTYRAVFRDANNNRMATLTVRVTNDEPRIALSQRGRISIANPGSIVTLTPRFTNYNWNGGNKQITLGQGKDIFEIIDIKPNGVVVLIMKNAPKKTTQRQDVTLLYDAYETQIIRITPRS